MKYFILLLLVLCAAISGLHAQDAPYLPTAVEGANWVIEDSETPHFPYLSFVRRIEGDTTVDGRDYKKLYQQVIDHIMDEHTDPPLARPYNVFPERELIALLRDDIAERRVYGKVRSTFSGAAEFSEDVLLHDYKLEVGDTLRGAGFDPNAGAPVIYEVGEEFSFGQVRRVQRADDGSYIEGIGSKYGPTSGGSALLIGCCINSIVEYCVGDLSDCNIWLTPVTELHRDLTIKSHPNPFKTQLNFTPSENHPGETITVSLRDLAGRLLKEDDLGNGLQWTTGDLAPGVYLATFTSGMRSSTVKLVKQ
ncbi:T9SS type A sorting domain-containing protein [Neolewinella aurantiaca]|uniref:T9SS type A sorting domain-containing protein n=1 Tax=Neolewinella aurantiaca TaxID=2602767 RepID=A0A5C7FLD1_9BACT|nr:T9SS type A sorting domain-containing protein [Neolewinella aurantiaca]TXF88178.1 T9SS type A sorting domain-containing protein [Neolewinella aurantiaca]